MDLSKLSDADLDALEKGDLSRVSDEGLSNLEEIHGANSSGTPELREKVKRDIGEPSTYQPTPNEKWMEDNAVQAGAGSLNPAMAEGFSTIGRGISKGGDWLMQKAVGMKKFIPGVGQTLADNGVIGTKGMMRDQLNTALSSTGKKIGELAEAVPNASTDIPSQKLVEEAQKLVQTDGFIKPEDMPKYRKLMQAADAVAERGGPEGLTTGSTAAGARASAGRIANEAGAYRDIPSQAVKAAVNRTEQAGWSEALKAPGNGAGPAVNDALTEADNTFSNLSKAKRPLNTPQSIPQSALGMASKAGLGALLGYETGGAKGAVAGAMLSTPAALSTGARGAMALGNTLSSPAVSSSLPGLINLLKQKQATEGK